MSRFGIIDLFGLAVALVFAIPIGLFGLGQLLEGQLFLGIFGLGTACLMIALEQYVWTPDDIPGDVAQRVAGRIVRDSGESDPDEQERT